ncbi:MAG TPA: SCP2 sterol-binding domain-containing protein [Acidimicrobiales bacterium]|nr:SCP2 sterol-binding domain-containing protein [Acidimicrobiales bacterium]
MRYLSPEWMAAAGRALANDGDLRAATSELTLTIEQVVTGAPGVPDGGTVRWQVKIDHGRVALVDRPAGAADLRFSADHPTAVQIASGELAAQRAFVEGRLQVGGDLSLLTRHQRVFATIDDTLAKVRTETTFD